MKDVPPLRGRPDFGRPASWDWRWSAVADGMKLVPPDITFGAAPIDVTPRTCGVVHICMVTNVVFCIVFDHCREDSSCRVSKESKG